MPGDAPGGGAADDDLTAQEEAEFYGAVGRPGYSECLNAFYFHNGPLPDTSTKNLDSSMVAAGVGWDFQYEGWEDDSADSHPKGVKINGFSGFPHQTHWMQMLSWLFISIQLVHFHVINLPLMPYSGNIFCAFLIAFFAWLLVISNVACCLTQSADPNTFGTKRWSKREYLLWLRIKLNQVPGVQGLINHNTYSDGHGISTTYQLENGHNEKHLTDLRAKDGTLLPNIEALAARHPRSYAVRRAIPVMDWQERFQTALRVYDGKLKDKDGKPPAVYPTMRWCKWCHLMVAFHSYHDHNCNKCVYQIDHFCKWLNSSVGDANYHLFQIFTLCCFWLEVFHAGIGLFQVCDIFLDPDWYRIRIEAVYPTEPWDNPSDSMVYVYGNHPGNSTVCSSGCGDAALDTVRVFLCFAFLLSLATIGQLGFLYGFHMMLWRLGDPGTRGARCRGKTTVHYWNTVGEYGQEPDPEPVSPGVPLEQVPAAGRPTALPQSIGPPPGGGGGGGGEPYGGSAGAPPDAGPPAGRDGTTTDDPAAGDPTAAPQAQQEGA